MAGEGIPLEDGFAGKTVEASARRSRDTRPGRRRTRGRAHTPSADTSNGDTEGIDEGNDEEADEDDTTVSAAKGWRLFRRGLGFLRPDRRKTIGAIALALGVAALGAAEPLVMKLIFDGLAEGAALSVLLLGVGLLVGLHVAKEATAALSNWLNWRVRISVKFRMLEEIVDRLHHLPLTFHQRQSVGGLMTRLQRGTEGFVAALDQFVFQTIPAVAYLIMAGVLMFQLDWRLALLVLGLTPLPALLGVWAAREQTARERVLLERWVNIYARFHEVLGGMRLVKSFSAEDREKRRFLDNVGEANAVVVRGVARDSALNGLRTLLTVLARVAALGVGGWLVLRGEVTLGTMVAFLAFVDGFFAPVQGLTGIYQGTRRGLVGLEVVFDILDHQERLGDQERAVEAPHLRGRVRFEDLHFGYREGVPVLRGLDLDVAEGEMVAIVGPSGSGKTTLMALLQRLYVPWRGRILLDGKDIGSFTQKSIRRQIGVVFQDTLLFNDPVHEIIAYGRPDATREEVVAAAEAAQAHGFITELAEGYDTKVGERGDLLSAGQRQRIAIARCLLKRPSIVILDEATSALDAESEAKVQAAVDRLVRGRTTFVIAHRLATVVEADRIIVLREGHVAEQGTHSELIERGGYYAMLVRHQVSGLLVER